MCNVYAAVLLDRAQDETCPGDLFRRFRECVGADNIE